MPPQITWLKVPAFDLNWLSFGDDAFILMPGGGGSTKSGIKNQIQIAHERNEKAVTFDIVDSIATDTGERSCLCNAVCSGNIEGIHIICAAFDNMCRIYKAVLTTRSENDENDKVSEKKTTSSGLSISQVAEFEADFSKEESSINCMCIISTGLIITGGNDGVCRVWSIDLPTPGLTKEEEKEGKQASPNNNNNSSSSSPLLGDDDSNSPFSFSSALSTANSWEVTLEMEMKKHIAPIMAMSLHPTENLLCTASKDGTCQVWSLATGTVLVQVPHVQGLLSAPGGGKGGGGGGTLPIHIECRGCCFSRDGFLYSIQSGKRGASHLIKWEFKEVTGDDVFKSKNVVTKGKDADDDNDNDNDNDNKDEDKPIILEAIPLVVVLASKVPSTKLTQSENGEYVAVGSCDGAVIVFASETLRKISSTQCHDFPVTGLSFVPNLVVAGTGYSSIVTSCSADNKLATVTVGGFSSYFIVLYVFLSGGCVIVLMYLSFLLLSRSQ